MTQSKLITIAFTLLITSMNAQTKPLKMKTINYQIKINKSSEEVWNVLAKNYATVGTYHNGIQSSFQITDTPDQGIGAARHCTINNRMYIKEKIIDWQEGNSFSYEAYDWKGMPLKKSINTIHITRIDDTTTLVESILQFRMKPNFLSGIMKGKMKKSLRESLLGHKHYIETGEKNVDAKTLQKKYKNF